jgi:hypothetical protein
MIMPRVILASVLALLASVLGCSKPDEGEWKASGDSGRTIYNSKTGEVRPIRDYYGKVIDYSPGAPKPVLSDPNEKK